MIGPGRVTHVAVYLVIIFLSIVRVSEGTLQCSKRRLTDWSRILTIISEAFSLQSHRVPSLH
jgi:hypothetical protein